MRSARGGVCSGEISRNGCVDALRTMMKMTLPVMVTVVMSIVCLPQSTVVARVEGEYVPLVIRAGIIFRSRDG